MSTWGHQWKMVFNPDITKQAVEVKIIQILISMAYQLLVRNYTKHIGAHLGMRLNFSKHISEAVRKASKGLSFLKYLPRYVLCKIPDLLYQLYVHPFLDYAYIICHNQREELMNLLEQVQYKTALIQSQKPEIREVASLISGTFRIQCRHTW